jgi:hypothetical protein
MWGQLMRPEFILPKVLPPAISWLKTQADLVPLHGGRVSDEMSQTLPCLRVTVGFYLPANRWERKPVYQIDAWATTMSAADTLGTTVANVWPDFKGNVGVSSYVAGAWLHTDGPLPLRDPDTQLFRTMVQAALEIHAGGF